jgi:hypothetical protein
MDSWIRASEGYWAEVLYTTLAVLVEANTVLPVKANGGCRPVHPD